MRVSIRFSLDCDWSGGPYVIEAGTEVVTELTMVLPAESVVVTATTKGTKSVAPTVPLNASIPDSKALNWLDQPEGMADENHPGTSFSSSADLMIAPTSPVTEAFEAASLMTEARPASTELGRYTEINWPAALVNCSPLVACRFSGMAKTEVLKRARVKMEVYMMIE